MNNVEKDAKKIIEKLDAEESEKREKKIQKLLARERVMEAEFSNLGW